MPAAWAAARPEHASAADAESLFQLHWPRPKHPGHQVLALDELHHEERTAVFQEVGILDPDNVGMLKQPQNAGFDYKRLLVGFLEDL